jgi:tetratricopeptide (TPR) repeat protein
VGELLNAVRRGGSYKFLRCRDIDGRRRAEFRVITPAGALSYHEFVLASSDDGLVRAVDCYVFLTGQLQSEALRETFLPFAQRWSKGGLDQLAGPEKDFVTHFSEYTAMVNWFREKEHRRVLEIYKRMPDSLKKMKTVLAIRLRSAQSISDDEYLRAIEDYRNYYPKDASIDLMAVDALILRKSYDKALASLDRVDKSVGGDPYLKVLRANVLQLQQKSDAAGKMAEAAVAEEPTLIQAYYSLVRQSLQKRNFSRTAELLSTVESKFKVKFQDLTTVPAYAEFVKSEQYKTWLKSHGGED